MGYKYQSSVVSFKFMKLTTKAKRVIDNEHQVIHLMCKGEKKSQFKDQKSSKIAFFKTHQPVMQFKQKTFNKIG